MRITKLEAENILRLKAVRITPNGGPVVLGGKNMAGKSSVLTAIQMAFGGKKNIPDEPVRHGAKKAHVIAETEDYIVTRRFRADGDSELEVKAKDGSKVARPQELLDKMCGALTFDPLAFGRMDPEKQADVLRRLVGLDFTPLEKQRAEAYEQRTEASREARRLQATIDQLPESPDGTPDAEVSIAELAAQLEAKQAANTKNDEQRRELADLREKAKAAKEKIAKLEAELHAARAEFAALDEQGRAMRSEVDALVDENLEAVKEAIANAEKTNQQVRAKVKRAELIEAHETQIAESERLTEVINQIDQQKAETLASAKYPVPGLELAESEVRLNGVPFSQASQAERLRASVAIGAATNPELRVMLIREGAFLDEDNMKLLEQVAEEHDIQLWVEMVADRKEVTVVIADGEVAEDRTGKDGPSPAMGIA